jgi:eukaryotic-like serine/threonine-protein kinase
MRYFYLTLTHSTQVLIAIGAFIASVGCGLQTPISQAESQPVPLVEEQGLMVDPAISPDGRWLAYASDRGGSEFLEIYIQPLAGGASRRLTSGSADQLEPAFAPDGNTLAYRSDAAGGGVYAISLPEGPPRLLAQGGRRPRFSPDGEQLAYWAALPGTSGPRSTITVIRAQGGEPRAIQPAFDSARDAVWSPDGKHLLFAGCKDGSVESCDWWVTPAEGGEAVATGASELFGHHKIETRPEPGQWLTDGAILFAARTGENSRIWTVNLDRHSWRVAGPPRRITPAEEQQFSPAATSDGRIVFARRTGNIDVWMLPLQADKAVVTGALTRLTTDPSIDQRPSLSLDGKKIAWETSRGGNFEVWVKDLVSGEEKGLTSGPLREHMPALSRDGSRLAYDVHDGEKVTVYLTAFGGGEPQQIWEDYVGLGTFQWAPKGDALLYFHREPPGSVGLLNLSSKKRTVLLQHPSLNFSLADARLSPDAHWIAFPVPSQGNRSRLAIARISGKVIEDERQWHYVTADSFSASQPEWSPDGQSLYFFSDQTGRLAVWALALTGDKRPRAEPKPILDLPGVRLTLAGMRPRDIGLAVATDKLALAITEYGGGLYSVQGR